MKVYELSVKEARDRLLQREISSRELTLGVLERIREIDPKIHAYLEVSEELAMEQAEEADKRLAKGDNISPLTGIPIAIKDNICAKGVRTTCASRILENFTPPYDATVISHLKQAGAVILGKTNMDEFAMGSSTENSGFQITRNPWNLERIPGGSSGGSAAAVASDMAICALGSDTGGSIRQPASYCSVVGLKPTYGRVSRYGLVAYGSSLDQIGPLTKNVIDAAIVLSAIAGHDPRDSTSVNKPVPDYTSYCREEIEGLRIGVPREYFAEGMDPEVANLVHSAIRRMEEMGAEIVDISLPHTQYAIACYYICAMAEASSNLARYDGAHYGYRAPDTDNIIEMYSKTRAQGFGAEVKRRIMLGTYALSAGYYDAYYLKALRVRTLIKRDFENAFEKVDIVATPVTPTAAFKIGEKITDPLTMYLSDIYTISLNLAGMCGISIPCGFTGGSLPVGLQLIANIFQEDILFRAAYAYEQSTPHHKRKPDI
ncbi:Asp-tRNA(Asn)/Glu-tRNA(Gln) amidotransferase subunit GatA [Candidatus Sumerlaeota bacterium]|nr:Asp-tRNA(Asn)/Glu-tRNA(Gln) amidotransferase subunit GatA [Candidatus Sumerlaeota bacterium]